MTATIATVIAAAVGGIGAFFTWKSSKLKQRREAEKDVAAEHAASDARRAEIEAAVHGNDEAKVNELVARLLAPAFFATLCAVVIGCASAPTRTVYIQSDRRIEAVTNSIGVACQAVPNAVFAEMLVKIQRLDDMQRAAEAEARIK